MFWGLKGVGFQCFGAYGLKALGPRLLIFTRRVQVPNNHILS